MQAKRQRRWAMIGPELVGKSRTAWYFIHRFVNARRAKVATGVPMPVVVYEHRVSHRTWEFTPDCPNDAGTTYSGWELPFTALCADTRIRSLQNAANVYVVDAGSEQRLGPPLPAHATTVLLCPVDPTHHGLPSTALGSIRGMDAGSVDALVAAAPYMTEAPEKWTEDVVRVRAVVVGGMRGGAFVDFALDMVATPSELRRAPHLRWVDGLPQLSISEHRRGPHDCTLM